MAGGKETPRQKMIGLMYLVLMALLAMNVSKEVLNSFVIINEGLNKTNENFRLKNADTYAKFSNENTKDPVKVGPWWVKAQQVQTLSATLDNEIEKIKRNLIAQVEKIPGDIDEWMKEENDSLFDLRKVKVKDNYDKPTSIMIGSDPANPIDGEYTAVDLKNKIEAYKSDLLALLDEEDQAKVKLGLSTEKVRKPEGVGFEEWENGNFYHIPLAAVVTNLSKMQVEVKNAEADVVRILMSKIGENDFKFDRLEAKVIPNTNYLILGDTFSADVFVAAFNSTQDPTMVVGTELDTAGKATNTDSAGVTVDNGIATWKFKPTSEGLVEWGGVISIKSPSGEYVPYEFNHNFLVAKPTLVVSPTAMNVFYRGLANPVEVSVPGIPTEQLKVSVSNASSSGSGGSYEIRPGKGKESVVSVSAEINGETKSFGEMKFRVKNVPDPKPYFAQKTGTSTIQRKALLASRGIAAKMENFEFDLKFTVTSFIMSATVKGKVVELKSGSNKVTSDQRTLLQNMRSKQKVYLEKIKAKGPDGTVRDLGTIVLTVI